jgi:hypothetical protein
MRDTLDVHFWLPPGADASRTLRTFEDGRKRIVAVAKRKVLARRERSVRLTRELPQVQNSENGVAKSAKNPHS